jgi:regulator of cell morphogenesis and NO signaling
MKTVPNLGDLTVNETIRLYPETVAVFSRHGIDACCGGGLQVREAAVRHGLDVAALVAELEQKTGAAA